MWTELLSWCRLADQQRELMLLLGRVMLQGRFGKVYYDWINAEGEGWNKTRQHGYLFPQIQHGLNGALTCISCVRGFAAGMADYITRFSSGLSRIKTSVDVCFVWWTSTLSNVGTSVLQFHQAKYIHYTVASELTGSRWIRRLSDRRCDNVLRVQRPMIDEYVAVVKWWLARESWGNLEKNILQCHFFRHKYNTK
jgi:hypothetical protein